MTDAIVKKYSCNLTLVEGLSISHSAGVFPVELSPSATASPTCGVALLHFTWFGQVFVLSNPSVLLQRFADKVGAIRGGLVLAATAKRRGLLN